MTGDSVVDKSEVAQCERVSQQPVGIGLLFVARPHVFLGAFDDIGVVPGQLAGSVHRDESNVLRGPVAQRFQLFGADHRDVGHGQHPVALIAVWVVEDVQLCRPDVPHSELLVQRTFDGYGQRLAVTQEGARQCPLAGVSALHLHHQESPSGVNSQQRGVHGDDGAGELVAELVGTRCYLWVMQFRCFIVAHEVKG